jgi:hypothetical protein
MLIGWDNNRDHKNIILFFKKRKRAKSPCEEEEHMEEIDLGSWPDFFIGANTLYIKYSIMREGGTDCWPRETLLIFIISEKQIFAREIISF